MPADFPELSAPAFEALAKAALLQDPFPIQALVASGTPPQALDPLFDGGLLTEQDDGEACLSDRLERTEILSRLSWSAKRKLSLSLAQAYASLNEDPAMAARLYLQAQQHREARSLYLRAAREMCQVNEYTTALESLRAAFEIWPIDEDAEQRASALHEMARCATNCQDHRAACLALEELLEMASERQLVSEQIELRQRLAQALGALGDHLRAREHLETGAAVAEKAGMAEQSAKLLRRLAQAQGDALRLRDALKTLDRARGAALACQDWALVSDILAYAAMLTAMLGRIEEANTTLDEALSIAIERDLPEQITNAYRRKANINEYASNYEAYRDTELAALDRCRVLNQKSGAQACLTCVAYAFFRLGQYEESLEAIHEAIEIMGVEGELLAGARCIRVCIQALRTHSQELHPQLEEALRYNRMHGGRVFEFYLLWTMGANAILAQELPIANDAFERLIALWKDTDDCKDVVPGLLCAASHHCSENQGGQLARCIDILNTISIASESAEPRWALLAASAEDAWLRGKPQLAIERFREASEGYKEMRLPFERAWTLWRLAQVQYRTGNANDAVATWREAEELAKFHGLRPLARAIARDRRLLKGDNSETPVLTPRQLEVARLIAAGCSNKEAADALSLSPRTVEMHVASLIERLGCRSRAEAASRASQLGLIA